MHTIPQLQPGDAILYKPTDWVGWVIAFKTWTKTAHIEVYCGDGISFASRNGRGKGNGVNFYPTRLTDLAAIVRPVSSLYDVKKSIAWGHTVVGQPYDWLAILTFSLLVKHGERGKMICSEAATHFYHAGGLRVCQPEWHADRVSPSLYLFTPPFNLIYREKGLF